MPLFTCLPFTKAEYEHDFKSADSLKEFRDLLGHSTSVLELAGSRADKETMNRAYELAGMTTVIQADLIIAVWDGGPSRGRGGTREMIDAATRIGTPVIHLDPAGIEPALVKWRGLSAFPSALEDIADLPAEQLGTGLVKAIEELVKPPSDEDEQASMNRFFAETGRLTFRRLEWSWMLFFAGVHGMRLPQSSSPDPDRLARAFADQLAPFAYAQRATRMIRAFGWADAIGTYYSHMFRSAFVFNFFVAALTVTSAAASTLMKSSLHVAAIGVEAFLICFVIANTLYGRWRLWHQRWFEGRELAERLRVALPFWALGIWPGTFTGPEPTWGGWYVRALMREQVPPEGHLDRKTLAAYRAALLRLLRGQQNYHEATARSMDQLNVRMELVSVILLVCSLFPAVAYIAADTFPAAKALAAHFATGWLGIPSDANWHGYLAVSGVVLPAFATASYGVRVIGDFEGTAERSRRSTEALKWLIDALEQDDEDLTLMRARTYAAADAMLGDVESWRLAAESRALAIPG